jgi:hypothetical protein
MKSAFLYVLFHTSATNSPASTSIVATRDDAADIDGEVKEGVGDEKDNDEDDCVDEVPVTTEEM